MSVLGAGTPSVTETLRGSGTAAYGSEVFTDLTSPQPYVHRVLGLPPSVLYYFRVSAQTVQGLGSRQLSTPRSIAASYQLPAAPDAPVRCTRSSAQDARAGCFVCLGGHTPTPSFRVLCALTSVASWPPAFMCVYTLAYQVLVASTTTTITLAWNHPVETGGTNVTGYLLELNDWAGGGDWITAYDGTGNPYVRAATVTEPYVVPGRR